MESYDRDEVVIRRGLVLALLDLAAGWQAEAGEARVLAAERPGAPSGQLWAAKAAVLGRCARELREALGDETAGGSP